MINLLIEGRIRAGWWKTGYAMHAPNMKSFIAFAAFLSSIVSASPIASGAAIESPLETWVSVDASGSPVATITPVLTTINGIATTISANPGATISSTLGDSKPTATSTGAQATSTEGGSFPICHNLDGQFAPFCLPGNGSSVYVGETYYVTWDINYFAEKNATILLQANYINTSDGGPQAFQSPITANYRGFYAWTIDKAWLKGESWNNVTLYLYPSNPAANEPQSFTGPTVMITNRPPTWYRQPKTPVPEGRTLYIALPTVFGAIVLLVCGTHLWNRKNRRIGLGNVMGRRKGYGTGKSRAQRLRLHGKNKVGDIQLREQELTANGQYRDVPDDRDTATISAGRPRADSDSLGSLVGTPTEERPNYFRDEMRRQEQRGF